MVVGLACDFPEKDQLPSQQEVAELAASGSLQHRGVGDSTDIRMLDAEDSSQAPRLKRIQSGQFVLT